MLNRDGCTATFPEQISQRFRNGHIIHQTASGVVMAAINEVKAKGK